MVIWHRTYGKGPFRYHMGYSFRLAARVLLNAPSHRQDSTYHSLCYTSHGALAVTSNSSVGPLWRIDPTSHRTMSERSYHGATSRSKRPELKRTLLDITCTSSISGVLKTHNLATLSVHWVKQHDLHTNLGFAWSRGPHQHEPMSNHCRLVQLDTLLDETWNIVYKTWNTTLIVNLKCPNYCNHKPWNVIIIINHQITPSYANH